MDYRIRSYPMFAACGLNCGLCPRFYTEGKSRCAGCGGEDFLINRPICGALSCCQRKGLEYCYMCGEYPCKKYEGANLYDSFITHKNQFKDAKRAMDMGLEAYKRQLDEKVGILQELLRRYNSGRQKNMYCLACNLLELHDLRAAMDAIKREVKPTTPLTQRVLIATRVIKNSARDSNIELKLRKKGSL